MSRLKKGPRGCDPPMPGALDEEEEESPTSMAGVGTSPVTSISPALPRATRL